MNLRNLLSRVRSRRENNRSARPNHALRHAARHAVEHLEQRLLFNTEWVTVGYADVQADGSPPVISG